MILNDSAIHSTCVNFLLIANVLSRAIRTGSVARLKCPYCPLEQNPSEAKQLYF